VKNSFNNANYKGRSVRVDEAGGPGKSSPRPSGGTGYQGGGGGGYKGGGGGGYKGGGGGYQGGAPRSDRGDRPQGGGGYRGNDDRGGYPKKDGFYEPKPKFPKKERK
jgi:hypothetical protein